MTPYNIKLLSPLRFVITSILPFILLILLTEPSGSYSYGFIKGILLAIFSIFVLPRYTATAVIEATIKNDGLQIIWLRQFLFQRKPNYFIAWSDVKEYKHHSSIRYEQFKLTLLNGSKVEFKVDNMLIIDKDFPKFLAEFNKRVEEVNFKLNNPERIKRAKSIYETTIGLTIAISYAIVMIAIPVVLYFFPPIKGVNYIPLVIGYVGLIFYIAKVIEYRRPNKTQGYS